MTFYDKYKELGDEGFRIWLAAYKRIIEKHLDRLEKISRRASMPRFTPKELDRPDLEILKAEK